ncbi:Hypothetical_protein [Hexamita inflata]|uniref:Hypothetical_protein n=1 Tax=Hexamita inflata TaxID=28002 RepID=A0AA86NBE9_9EUKA|nr:Hypothetical protein HINF_LOCUS3559 [Hexamita inflata]
MNAFASPSTSISSFGFGLSMFFRFEIFRFQSSKKCLCKLQTMENLRKVSFRLQYTIKTPSPTILSVMHRIFQQVGILMSGNGAQEPWCACVRRSQHFDAQNLFWFAICVPKPPLVATPFEVELVRNRLIQQYSNNYQAGNITQPAKFQVFSSSLKNGTNASYTARLTLQDFNIKYVLNQERLLIFLYYFIIILKWVIYYSLENVVIKIFMGNRTELSSL